MAFRIKEESEEYDLLRPWKTLDKWQVDYINETGNCALITARQSGKTTAMSIKLFEQALKFKKGEDILCVALTERQAFNIFSKCLSYGLAEYPREIVGGKDKPTKHRIVLKNGVKIMCEPTGLQGEGLRGFTCKKVFVDEASRVSDTTIVEALLPMLSVVNGTIDISSTPCGKVGYFWRAFNPLDEVSKSFKTFKVKAEDCPRHKKEFLDLMKSTMSELQYMQEYGAEFLDDLKRFFSSELIADRCQGIRRTEKRNERRYYLGVDIARLGKDLSAFEIFDGTNPKYLEHIENITTSKQLTTQTANKIQELNKQWNFVHKESIGIDAGAGSLGVGIYDWIMTLPELRNKVVGLNNRKRALDRDGKQTQRLFKEDMYNNLKALMERKEILLLKDDDVIEAFGTIQYEYIIHKGQAPQLHIFGDGTDIIEGIIRAVWLASRNKVLNIMIDYV